MTKLPALILTVDVEEDNAWLRDGARQTKNAAYIGRFHELCLRYGFRPTYLTTSLMAESPIYAEFARGVAQRNEGEIGLHIHAWNTPPIKPLTRNDDIYLPYLHDFSEDLISDKLDYVIEAIRTNIGVTPVSYRGGRWGLDGRTARILASKGITADCSITPHVNWDRHDRDPDAQSAKGLYYFNAPEQPYFLSEEDVTKPGNLPILELPFTTVPPKNAIGKWLRQRVIGNALIARLCLLADPPRSMRLIDGNEQDLKDSLNYVLQSNLPYAQFMIHSSEFMPGGSPYTPDEESVDKLFAGIERLFVSAGNNFVGQTVGEYRNDYVAALEKKTFKEAS
ncbi:MAG: hypothetical protein JSS72_02255 [Armatimonadetes bacterium]|nr:hypothetical protein [Armatimonadota bacterium]